MKAITAQLYAVGLLAGLVLAAVCLPTPEAAAGPFTLVAMPDIQNETESDPTMLQSQVSWIVNNRAVQNIAFVAQQGDVVNYPEENDPSEYITAHNILFQLNGAAGLPWGTCPGNHDFMASENAVMYDQYFGPSNFVGQSWYGSSTSNRSSYQTFQAGGRNYLVLDLEFDAPESVLDWAQGVIDANPGTPTIINTHDYIEYGETRSEYGNFLWDNLINENSQVFLVLCGHNHYAYNQTSLNAAGQPVFELLADYQDENLGDGYLRLYQFDEANSAIHVTSYSPYDAERPYLTDSLNQFDLPLDFTARLGAVPEPSTLVLLCCGGLGLIAYLRRRPLGKRR
jgi:hypothetical protein